MQVSLTHLPKKNKISTYLGNKDEGRERRERGEDTIFFFQILNIYIYIKQTALKFNRKE